MEGQVVELGWLQEKLADASTHHMQVSWQLLTAIITTTVARKCQT
jgi:hypothetical protein